MEPLDFQPDVVAKLSIEIAERFIDRKSSDRARSRGPIATRGADRRKLTWKSLEKLRKYRAFRRHASHVVDLADATLLARRRMLMFS